MKVALISDLHANRQALEAVLNDIAAEGVDEIVCLGDIVDLGPEPGAVIERLRRDGIRCLMGNHDPFWVDAIVPVDVYHWTRAQLSADELEWLRALPADIELGEPGATLLCVHGSPRSYDEQILPTTSDSELERMVEARHFDVLACGHTHVQLSRKLGHRVVVNAGSVGMPFEKPFLGEAPPRALPWSEYAIVELSQTPFMRAVDLRRVNYDVDAYFEAVKSSSMPDPAGWIAIWLPRSNG